MNASDLLRRMNYNSMPTLNEAELKAYSPKIISAVQEIHKAGYLHNNITPDNIILHRNKKSSTVNEFSVRLGGLGHVAPISKNSSSSKQTTD